MTAPILAALAGRHSITIAHTPDGVRDGMRDDDHGDA